MDEAVAQALEDDPTIDITTTGRRTGEARRIEIWMLVVDGRFFITGTPGRRDWLANLLADPHLTVHLKHGVVQDLPARATVVLDVEARRHVLTHVAASWYRSQSVLEDLVANAPLVEVVFDQ
jgi:deazaflavin-dependent oxidoreductase (nitroreductase family)